MEIQREVSSKPKEETDMRSPSEVNKTNLTLVVFGTFHDALPLLEGWGSVIKVRTSRDFIHRMMSLESLNDTCVVIVTPRYEEVEEEDEDDDENDEDLDWYATYSEERRVKIDIMLALALGVKNLCLCVKKAELKSMALSSSVQDVLQTMFSFSTIAFAESVAEGIETVIHNSTLINPAFPVVREGLCPRSVRALWFPESAAYDRFYENITDQQVAVSCILQELLFPNTGHPSLFYDDSMFLRDLDYVCSDIFKVRYFGMEEDEDVRDKCE